MCTSFSQDLWAVASAHTQSGRACSPPHTSPARGVGGLASHGSVQLITTCWITHQCERTPWLHKCTSHHKCGYVFLQPEVAVHWLDADISQHPTERMLLPQMEVLIPAEQLLTVSNVLSTAVSSPVSLLLTDFHAAFLFLFRLSPSLEESICITIFLLS